MGNAFKSKFQRVFYNLNRLKKKSGEKHKNALLWYVLILKKQAKQGETKWIYKTKKQAEARLKKYGISMLAVKDHLEKK